MDNQMMSLSQFGQTIKAKYPQYQNMSDEEVGNAVLQKYPQYQAKVNAGDKNSQEASNPLMDILAAASKPLRVGAQGIADLGTTGAYGIDKYLLKDPNADQKLLNVKPIFVNDQENKYAMQHPVESGVKAGLAAGSLMVSPETLGMSGVPGVLASGAATGGLQTASGDNPTPGTVIAGMGAGSLGAGAMHGLGALFSKVLAPVGKGLEETGNKVISSQYAGVPAAMARNNKLNETVAQLGKYGITGIDDVINKAPQITGGDGLLNTLVKDAVSKADPVDVGGISKLTQNLLDQEPLLSPTQRKSFKQIIINGLKSSSPDVVDKGAQKGAKDAMYGVGDTGTAKYSVLNATANPQNLTEADPTKMFDFIRDLEGKSAEYSRSQDESAKALSNVYKGVASELKDRLFGGFDATGKVTRKGADRMLVTPAEDQLHALHNIHPQLAQDVMSAKNVSELRKLQAPFVRGSKLAQAVEERAGAKPLDAFDVLSYMFAGPQAIPAIAVRKFAGSNKGKELIGKTIAGTGSMVNKAAGVSAPSGIQQLLELLSAKGASSLVK